MYYVIIEGIVELSTFDEKKAEEFFNSAWANGLEAEMVVDEDDHRKDYLENYAAEEGEYEYEL